jgi:uncharacterized protein (DUF433 family)
MNWIDFRKEKPKAERSVIRRSRLTRVIAERFKAGESIHDLAVDYLMTVADIQQAIRLQMHEEQGN